MLRIQICFLTVIGGHCEEYIQELRHSKSMFKYIEPKRVPLGNDENMKERFAYYIPVKQTLISLSESELWKNSVSQESCETDSLSDGQSFKSNQFFVEN